MEQNVDLKNFFADVYHLSCNHDALPLKIDALDGILSADFSAKTFIRGSQKPLQAFHTRESWKAFLVIIHGFFHETIIPLDYEFDIKHNRVEVKLKIKCASLKTGVLISEFSATGKYTLARENGSLKIASLELVADDKESMIRPYLGPLKLPRFMFKMMLHGIKYGV